MSEQAVDPRLEMLTQKVAAELRMHEGEAPDPFDGGEPSFEEFSKYREDGTIPERFKPEVKKEETPAAKAETVDGKEPPKEAEQDKHEQERDGKGKFRAKVEFSPEQQEVLNREIKRAKEKARRELEQQYAAKTSVTQATAADSKPEVAADAEEEFEFSPDGTPKEPRPPKHPGKLRDYQGTMDEYDAEIEKFEKRMPKYEAKKAAFLDAKREFEGRKALAEKRLADSQAKAQKAYPDYVDKYAELDKDVTEGLEPKIPQHVADAILYQTQDPYAVNYYLLTNIEEYRRLATVRAIDAVAEVKEIEFKIRQSPAPAKAPAPPKPKPPDPVGARASASGFDVNDESIDADTWARQRNEQLAKSRRR